MSWAPSELVGMVPRTFWNLQWPWVPFLNSDYCFKPINLRFALGDSQESLASTVGNLKTTIRQEICQHKSKLVFKSRANPTNNLFSWTLPWLLNFFFLKQWAYYKVLVLISMWLTALSNNGHKAHRCMPLIWTSWLERKWRSEDHLPYYSQC